LGELLDSLANNAITSAQAKQLLIEFMDGEARSTAELIKAYGWKVLDDDSLIRQIARDTLDKHPKEVSGYLKGQARRLNFLIGKTMQATKGQARPQDVSRIVKELLESASAD
ncbi:hypothetical protein LPJ57_008620, partial [Coemansia sp. RSA 486]